MKSPCHTNKESNFLPFFRQGHLSTHQFYSLHSSICGNTDNQFITIHVFCNGQFFLFPCSHFYSKALDNIQHIPSYLFLYTLSRIIYAFCECWYIFSHSFYKIFGNLFIHFNHILFFMKISRTHQAVNQIPIVCHQKKSFGFFV